MNKFFADIVSDSIIAIIDRQNGLHGSVNRIVRSSEKCTGSVLGFQYLHLNPRTNPIEPMIVPLWGPF